MDTTKQEYKSALMLLTEDLVQAVSNIPHIPLVKVFGLVG